MFLKNKNRSTPKITAHKKETIPSIITRDMNLLGNIVGEHVTIDFDGTLDGNIRCGTLTIRRNGSIKGEVVADNVFIYGKVNGLVKAKNVHLFASCHIEGIVMHESIAIEDGAFIDGKCKRTDKLHDDNEPDEDNEEEDSSGLKLLENIRLIR